MASVWMGIAIFAAGVCVGTALTVGALARLVYLVEAARHAQS